MKKRIFALLSCGLLFGSALTARASELTIMADGSVAVELTAVIGSKYVVSMPASLTLTAGRAEADGTPFTGTVEVGVKGNIAPGKSVVVVPMNGTVEGGRVTAESEAAGRSAVAAVTTEALNALDDTYDADISLSGSGDSGHTGTLKASAQYVRWAHEGAASLAKCETTLNNTDFTVGTVSLSTKLAAADTYTGNIQFTFKLVDRN